MNVGGKATTKKTTPGSTAWEAIKLLLRILGG